MPTRKRRMTPEDLRRLTLLGDAQISPDAASIVFVHKQVGDGNTYQPSLWIVSTDDGTPRRFTAGPRDIHPRWSPDGDRIAFICARKKPRPQIYVIPATGGEAAALTNFPEGSLQTFKWSPDGRHLAVLFREQDPAWTETAKKERKEKELSDPPREIDHYWYRLDGDGYFGAQRFQLYLVDTDTGEHRKLYARDTLGFMTFDFSPDSKQIVVSTNPETRAGLRPWNDQLLRIRVSTGKATRIPNLPEGPKHEVAWSPDGKWIAYSGRIGADPTYSTENLELWVCDAQRGGAKCLTKREDYCLMAAVLSDTADVAIEAVIRWHPNSKRIYLQLGWEGESHIASLRRAGGAIEFHTTGTKIHNIGNFANDGRMALTVGGATRLDEVGVVTFAGDKADVTMLTDLNGPLLREMTLSKPKPQWVKTADGTRVQVWTMLPPGASARRKHPAILEIHGGPHLQYGVGFFHEFQVLAAAGYAVFYCNPRGSKGYGRDHCHSIRGHWGTTDWVDIQAVTAFMKTHRNVNPKRMGVMGGSYGGYMTNWVIGNTREFAAAITDRCVSNMVTMGATSDFVEELGRYFPGNHWDDPELLWEQSPIRHMGKARTPTLIVHSEGDLRCNIEQSEQVFTALTHLKVPTRFVRYPRETSHGMSRAGPPDMRLHRLHEILAWMGKYLSR